MLYSNRFIVTANKSELNIRFDLMVPEYEYDENGGARVTNVTPSTQAHIALNMTDAKDLASVLNNVLDASRTLTTDDQ